MSNMVFSCPKCGRTLGEVPAAGRLVAICAKCRLKYEVVHGRVSDAASQTIVLREPGYRVPGAHTQRYQLRLELPTGRIEPVAFDSPDAEAVGVARPGDIVYAIYLMRRSTRDQLLTIHNETTGKEIRLALPGDRATSIAWIAGVVGAVGVALFASSNGAGPGLTLLLGGATLIGLGVGLSRRFMPREEISSELEAQLTMTQGLVAEKLRIETARAQTLREFDGRGELRERLLSLRTKMASLDATLYKPRIEAIDRALVLADSDLELQKRLRAGYDRSIKMLEIEIEAGATVDAFDTATAPHIAESIATIRDLEQQQADLGRQLSANAEVEALLRSSKS